MGGTVTKLEFRFKKKKGKEAPTPPQNSYLKFIKEWGTVEKKGLGRGAAVAALKNQGIVVTRSSKHRGYHGCKRLISVCIVHPHIGANSLSLCLQVTIGPHGVFCFPWEYQGKPTLSQAPVLHHPSLGRPVLMSADYSWGFCSKWGEITAFRETALSEVTARARATSFF